MNDNVSLKELRARKNKTQAEVDKDLSISPQTLTHGKIILELLSYLILLRFAIISK